MWLGASATQDILSISAGQGFPATELHLDLWRFSSSHIIWFGGWLVFARFMPISLVGQISYSLFKKIGGPKLFGVQEGNWPCATRASRSFSHLTVSGTRCTRPSAKSSIGRTPIEGCAAKTRDGRYLWSSPLKNMHCQKQIKTWMEWND